MERKPRVRTIDYDSLTERIMMLCRKLECDHFMSGEVKQKTLTEIGTLIKQRAKLRQ